VVTPDLRASEDFAGAEGNATATVGRNAKQGDVSEGPSAVDCGNDGQHAEGGDKGAPTDLTSNHNTMH